MVSGSSCLPPHAHIANHYVHQLVATNSSYSVLFVASTMESTVTVTEHPEVVRSTVTVRNDPATGASEPFTRGFAGTTSGRPGHTAQTTNTKSSARTAIPIGQGGTVYTFTTIVSTIIRTSTPVSPTAVPSTPVNSGHSVSGRLSHDGTIIVASISVVVPLLVGTLVAWTLLRRRRRKTTRLKTKKRDIDAYAAAETDGTPVSELADVKEAREVEDTGIREMDAPPVELEGDGLVVPARPDEGLVEAETWFRETLGAVLSTK